MIRRHDTYMEQALHLLRKKKILFKKKRIVSPVIKI
jgi:hypothetical protein